MSVAPEEGVGDGVMVVSPEGVGDGVSVAVAAFTSQVAVSVIVPRNGSLNVYVIVYFPTVCFA